ncbi:MAG: phosphoribosyltransferase [Rhizobiaceae bacterium]|nr:phosphoribosyltransferase [Rhizobiaceae bacterium]
MREKNLQLAPHDFWQSIHPAGSFEPAPAQGHRDLYPATLPDGRQIVLPIRVLPGGEDRAVASLILNQASFAVADALADAVADKVRALEVEIVVGLPTLGLVLADALARRLGHSRCVPLGTSRKFWYDEQLSQPLSSVTSPGVAEKRLYVDPRMLPLLAGRRVLLVDDVVSTGSSMASALALLARTGVAPAGIAVAMTQSERWRAKLADAGWAGIVSTAIATPLLARGGDGGWRPTM